MEQFLPDFYRSNRAGGLIDKMDRMTSAERERAVVYLQETMAAVLISTQGLSAEEWSIAECVEHLAIVEGFLLRSLQQMATAPEAPENELALAAGKEDLIVKDAPARKRKVKGPPASMPKGGEPDAMLALFVENASGRSCMPRPPAIRCARAFSHIWSLDRWMDFSG
jgi:hypothetical protein